jgi:hypothetical protein
LVRSLLKAVISADRESRIPAHATFATPKAQSCTIPSSADLVVDKNYCVTGNIFEIVAIPQQPTAK